METQYSHVGAVRLALLMQFCKMRKQCADLRDSALKSIPASVQMNHARLNRVINRLPHVGYDRWRRKQETS